MCISVQVDIFRWDCQSDLRVIKIVTGLIVIEWLNIQGTVWEESVSIEMVITKGILSCLLDWNDHRSMPVRWNYIRLPNSS